MKIWIFEKDGEVAAGTTKAAASRAMRDHLERNRLDPRYLWYAPDERPWTVSEVERESFSHQVELAGTCLPKGNRLSFDESDWAEGRLQMHPIGTPGYDPAEQRAVAEAFGGGTSRRSAQVRKHSATDGGSIGNDKRKPIRL